MTTPTNTNQADSSSEKHTATSYDLIAQRYAATWFDRPARSLTSRFLAHLPLPSRILDVGCGPGQYTRLFCEAGHEAYGIDISGAALRIALERCKLPVFVQMSMRRLGFANEMFDAVWACASVVHIPVLELPTVLLELARVLHPRGILFVNVPKGDVNRIESPGEFNEGGRAGRFFQRYAGEEDFTRALQRTGFIVLDQWEEVVSSATLQRAESPTSCWMNFVAQRTGSHSTGDTD